MSERQLYRLIAGKQTGPYPPEKLRPLMADGRISRLDRFSYDGVDWLPADQIPELVGKALTASPSAESAAAALVFPTPGEGGGITPLPPPPRPPGKVTPAPAQPRSSRLPLFAGIGVIGVSLLVAGVLLGLRGGILGSGGLRDITDNFGAVLKSTEDFEGEMVFVRGTYFPQELNPRASGRDYTIKFRSGGAKRAVASGDRQDRLTLVVPQAMGNRLLQIVGRLESEQPAILEIACTQHDAGGEKRPIGRVVQIKFCREAPTAVGARAFLQMDEDGEIEEE